MASSPPYKRRKGKENASRAISEKNSEASLDTRLPPSGSRRLLNTPATHGLCTAMTDANLASTTSVETAFPRLADIMGCSRERLAEQTFDGSTSPRLDSRLARRPKGQFPYALQPFRIMPAPPGEGSNLSVSEANRRLQQAQALSLRQQHFGQLLDLASTGFIPPRRCGAAAEEDALQGGRDVAVNADQEAISPQNNAERLAPEESSLQGAEPCLNAGPTTAANAESHSPRAIPLQGLISSSQTMTLRDTRGQGCIRIARLRT